MCGAVLPYQSPKLNVFPHQQRVFFPKPEDTFTVIVDTLSCYVMKLLLSCGSPELHLVSERGNSLGDLW